MGFWHLKAFRSPKCRIKQLTDLYSSLRFSGEFDLRVNRGGNAMALQDELEREYLITFMYDEDEENEDFDEYDDEDEDFYDEDEDEDFEDIEDDLDEDEDLEDEDYDEEDLDDDMDYEDFEDEE